MENIADKVFQMLEEIAQQLGIAAEKLYPVLRQQALIDGAWGIFIAVFSTIILILLVKTFIKYFKKIDEGANPHSAENAVVLSFVGSILTSIVVIINLA